MKRVLSMLTCGVVALAMIPTLALAQENPGAKPDVNGPDAGAPTAQQPEAATLSSISKGTLGLGGHFGLGGATSFASGSGGAFSLSITPFVEYFPIAHLALWARVIFWERIFYSYSTPFGGSVSYPIDILPFLVGVRYYFDIKPTWLKPYAGLGLGGAVAINSVASDTKGFFAMDMHGGVVFEVMPHLAIDASFDVYLPNLAPAKDRDNVIARFGFLGGVIYYFSP